MLTAIAPEDLALIVNVGDDEIIYGVHVAADLDTVMYTLAGLEGPHGWGINGDEFTMMDHLASLGTDTTFRLGDRDMATCISRTEALRRGEPLSRITAGLAASHGVTTTLLPATDDPLRTRVETAEGEWLSFQEYFVMRRHQDRVASLEYSGARHAKPAPGVIERIQGADAVLVAPSNPPLSIWPILAVEEIRAAVAQHDTVVAVSPLFGGKALKGPTESVMADLGLPVGTAGILKAYSELLTHLIIDLGDADDVASVDSGHIEVVARPTLLSSASAASRFGNWLADYLGGIVRRALVP